MYNFPATKHYFLTVTIISYTFSLAINKSLHTVLIEICTSGGDPLSLLPLLECTTRGNSHK